MSERLIVPGTNMITDLFYSRGIAGRNDLFAASNKRIAAAQLALAVVYVLLVLG